MAASIDLPKISGFLPSQQLLTAIGILKQNGHIPLDRVWVAGPHDGRNRG
jgi:hypothetical protein